MHGGKRSGAGRKPGAANKMSQEARAKAQETGELPHEFLLRVMRGEDIDGTQPEFKDRMAAAVAAAPYFAPKLASVTQEVTGANGGPLVPIINLTSSPEPPSASKADERLPN